MVEQADLDRVFTKMRGDEHEVSPYDSNFIAFAELQTQLMLEMRDLLREQLEQLKEIHSDTESLPRD